ncbi:hypothetical protein H8356DRAFT_1347161 [Neocallimastix lanati (nom. inval.)]|nr:hypothetical protein H8356DRAFT_1347161 [Neocallimastix sp. JGI-2020a]
MKEILKYGSSHKHPEKEYDMELKKVQFFLVESEYYKTKRGENFMIFKNSNLIIFQSPFQAKLFREYNDNIFVDGTVFIVPKFSYQIFITRTYGKELDSFYTTSFAILKNKEGISKAAKTMFPNTNIKYCIWHYKKSLEIKKKLNYAIMNIPFINPEYIFDIYFIIKIKSIKNNYCQILKFLEYFYETYLVNKLNELEHLSYYDYQRKLRGIWKIKKRAINKDNEISVLIERYKNIEAKLIDAKSCKPVYFMLNYGIDNCCANIQVSYKLKYAVIITSITERYY